MGRSADRPTFLNFRNIMENYMAQCNYIPLECELPSLYLDEIFDLDVLCTEEGILINSVLD